MHQYFTTSFWTSFVAALILVLLISCKKNSTGSEQENPEITITSDASFNVDENQTTVGTITATPKDDDMSFNITGGTDQDYFSINDSSGVLTFDSAPDFENPADADTNNTYQLTIEVSDDEDRASQEVSVSVNDVNENGPTITSPTSFEIQENTTTVGTVTANTSNGNNLEFALLGGTKGTLTFSIDASSGEISISPSPDFENPRDDNRDNTYEVDVMVNNGNSNATQSVSITVTNVVEVPAINRGTISLSDSQNYSLNETTEKNIYRFDPVPAGSDLSSIHQFSIGTSLSTDLATSASVTGGADGGLFSVSSINTYAIHIDGPSSLDYNHRADGNAHEYRFTVTAENAGGTTPEYTIIVPVAPFAGGSGTAANPYQVESIDQLQRVDQFLGAHFVQTADIDASATSGWNSGQGFKPIGDYNNRFSGSYNGDGHTISGLTMNRSQGTIYGLFGIISSGGQISNVKLTNIDIITEDTVGGLAGVNQGTITNSYVSGIITNSKGTVGGLVGGNNGTIRRSYSLANVDGRANVGGLVGTNSYGTIKNSYATGDVNASLTIVGGLVGNNKSTIEHSYATGTVTSGSTPGGLVGYEDDTAGSTLESYWDTQSAGLSTSDGGTGLTTSQMQGSAAQTNMTGFDFTNVWQTNAGDYPTLR